MVFVSIQCAIPFDSVNSCLNIYLSDIRAYTPQKTHKSIHSNTHRNLEIFHMLINRDVDRDIVIHSY